MYQLGRLRASLKDLPGSSGSSSGTDGGRDEHPACAAHTQKELEGLRRRAARRGLAELLAGIHASLRVADILTATQLALPGGMLWGPRPTAGDAGLNGATAVSRLRSRDTSSTTVLTSSPAQRPAAQRGMDRRGPIERLTNVQRPRQRQLLVDDGIKSAGPNAGRSKELPTPVPR